MPEPNPLIDTLIDSSLMFLNAISAKISSLPKQDFGFGTNNLSANLCCNRAWGRVVVTKATIIIPQIPNNRVIFGALIGAASFHDPFFGHSPAASELSDSDYARLRF